MLILSVDQKEGLGARLRQLRQREGDTLERTAYKFGITASHLSKIERGTGSDPVEPLILLVCRELGITKDWLLNGNGPPPELRKPHASPSGQAVTASAMPGEAFLKAAMDIMLDVESRGAVEAMHKLSEEAALKALGTMVLERLK